jgi:DNA end-binding protein Ku
VRREGVVVERADMVKGLRVREGPVRDVHSGGIEGDGGEGHADGRDREFVPAESIDPIYYDKAYFLGPDKGGAKPYALLAESMRQTKQTAVGRYAARGKQYIVQLGPFPADS